MLPKEVLIIDRSKKVWQGILNGLRDKLLTLSMEESFSIIYFVLLLKT